ncbi:MAG: ABC transporter ATP-binding protein [Bdellovibrionota bacterium]|nr:ABC transporter ATP-binding protein [Bdellovibrionota bacterium]
MNVIEAKGLYKNYGRVEALKDFSLEVKEGESYALLGKNGAGKTTFVKSLLGLIRFQEGSLKLFGHDVSSKEARRKVAYLPEKFSFYPYYTLRGVCEFYGEMKGLKGAELTGQVDRAIERWGIGSLQHKRVNECSKGQLQRTGLASTMIGENELFILDEPYSGLDPIGTKELQDYFKELSGQGKTLFINSHGLDSVEKVSAKMAILDNGELIVSGAIKELVGEQDLLDYFYSKVGR